MKQKSRILRLRQLPFRHASRITFRALGGFSRLFRLLGPQPDTRTGWDEFRNKLRAFLAFEYADLEFGISSRSELPLEQLVAKADAVGSYLSIFAIEGIGYHRAKLRRAEPPLLENVGELSPKAFIPLHAGLGLALAESCLRAFEEHAAQRASLVQQFADSCQNNSLPGYAGITFEALGFIARTLYPHLTHSVSECLSGDQERAGYFWHGVGRGVYFAPERAWPWQSARWNAVATCRDESPHEMGKRNTLAGLAWAFIMVNVLQPEIVAAFLQHLASEIERDDAFADGVCSAGVALQEMCAGDGLLQAITCYRVDAALSELWQKHVQRPIEEAVRHYALVKRSGTSQELFRYRKEALQSPEWTTTQSRR